MLKIIFWSIFLFLLIGEILAQYTQIENKEFFERNSWDYISNTLKLGSIVLLI